MNKSALQSKLSELESKLSRIAEKRREAEAKESKVIGGEQIVEIQAEITSLTSEEAGVQSAIQNLRNCFKTPDESENVRL